MVVNRMCSGLLLACLIVFGVGDAAASEVSRTELRKLKRELALIVKAQDANKMADYVRRVSKIDDPTAAGLLVEAAIAIPSAKNYQRAVRGIARFSNKETIEELIKIRSRARDFRQQVLILEGFGSRTDALTRDAVFDALKSKRVHVRLAAMRACVARKQKEAVPVLIDHLDRNSKGRNRDWLEARQALLDLTGQDFESVADWRNFWEGHQDTLDPKNLDKKDGPTKVVVRKTKDSVEFFGAEILSENVVFVLDNSGSMIAYEKDPDYDGDNIEFDRRRLERVKNQTIRALRKLRPKSRFNIIAFNNRVLTWKKSIVPASPQNLRKARQFVKGFQPVGFTHTDEALEKAFEDPSIDTIVLLSDGTPDKEPWARLGQQEHYQKIQDLQQQILERVKDLNASRKLRIDTFGFEGRGYLPKHLRRGGGNDDDDDEEEEEEEEEDDPGAGGGESSLGGFLRELAEQNDGEYRPIK